MTDKILCPWCGAEMVTTAVVIDTTKDDCKTALLCTQCHAQSPLCNTWTEAKEAALRRYTPPQPMTLQKPMAKLEEALGKEIDIEIKGEDRFRKVSIPVHARMAKQFEIIVPRNIAHIAPVILPVEDYGKTWRCWERKPTDEERSAAGWET